MSAPGARLELRQKQRLALTPGMHQALSVLALPGAALEEMLTRAAEENPFLVVAPRDAEPAGGRGQSAYDVALQNVAARPGLGEHLARQLALMDLPAEVSEIARRLAYDLDRNGFLPAGGVRVVAGEHGTTEAVAERAIRALQSCDPAGVGATSLEECLLLQLTDQGLSAERSRLVIENIPRFLRGGCSVIASTMGLSPEEAAALSRMVRALDPAPGRGFDQPEPSARVPELVVSDGPGGALTVELANDPLGRLSLDAALVSARREMSGGHRADAENLLRAVRFRGQTLLRIGRALAEAQARYFAGQSEELAPLTRVALAERLGLHKSTVGRAVAGKTLLWRGRIMEMEQLFPAPLDPSEASGPSSHAARLRIARLVAGERPGKVLSDAQIRMRLQEDGVDISRRTVAKYRQGLNIPPSSTRRRLLAGAGTRGKSR